MNNLPDFDNMVTDDIAKCARTHAHTHNAFWSQPAEETKGDRRHMTSPERCRRESTYVQNLAT